MKFTKFSIDESILKNLHSLHYDKATPIQRAVIPVVQANHDVMARAKTGTGKTAAFALPIINKLVIDNGEGNQPSVLIIAPTRELVQQIYTSCCKYGLNTNVKIGVAFGGVSIKPQIKSFSVGVDIIVTTPGRLLDLVLNDHLSLKNISTLVFDEADRTLDLGFRAEVDRILKEIENNRQTLLFSATFDDAIYKFSNELLNEPKIITIDDKNEVSDNIEQLVYTVDSDRKRELLSYIIGSKNWQQVLVFTRTKKTADELTKEMCKDGIKSLSFHGDKSQGARDKALLEFKQGKVRALVATDVAARGIDINNLEFVVNFELPYVAEDYVHRIGRTGRAGNKGVALSLVSPSETWLLTAIEKVIESRLLQQWFPGYEPDLTKTEPPKRSESKKKIRNKILKKSSKNNKHRSR